MTVELPQSVDDAIALPPPKPGSAMPSLLGVVCLWGAAGLAMHAVIWPPVSHTAAAQAASPQGLSAADAVQLTNDVVTALAADQFSSVLLKIQLAQKVAERLQPAVQPYVPK